MLARDVFRVGGTTYRWGDVVLAAQLWGDWAVLRGRVREGIACVKRSDETADALTAEEVDIAADAFRYERNLISAEEAESWLEERGLTAEAWIDYIRRSLLRQRWAAELPDITSHYPVTDAEVEPLMECEAICSGHLGQLSKKLAARAAAHDWLIEHAGAEAIESLLAKDHTGRTDREEKLEFLARLEVAFRDFCDRVPISSSIIKQISGHSLEWIRIDCLFLTLPDEEMAREAALCVREDGKSLAEVAAQVGIIEQQSSFLLEEIEPVLSEQFLAASKGELLGPLRVGDAFVLYWVLEKVMPMPDDARIRQRAERHLVQHAVNREVADRVRWHDRW
jgi:hypothetical protein